MDNNPVNPASRIINAAYPMLGNQSSSSSSFCAVFGVCFNVAWKVFDAIVSDARSQKGFVTLSYTLCLLLKRLNDIYKCVIKYMIV